MNNKKYSKTHEWIFLENDVATVGISNHAQESLGDIVFVELPDLGKTVKAASEISVIESVKAASDIYSPLDGEIIKVNEKIKEDPSIINRDSENEGWLFKIKLSNQDNIDDLMNIDKYNKFIEENK